MSATAQVTDGQMVPMSGATDSPRIMVTGQWVYDNFVNASTDEQISRMNMVRILAKQATDSDLKTALKDAVEIAHKVDVKNGVPEKERGPKRSQAMNARTVMQNAYGAIRRAPKELEKLGYTEKTGYQEMRVIASQALKAHGIKWNGTPIPTDEMKLQAMEKAEKQAKADAFSQARGENEQREGEEDFAYFQRLNGRANEILMEGKIEAHKRVASKLVVDLITKHGRDIAGLVVERLNAFLSETSEMTEDEANAALKAHAEAEAQADVSEEDAGDEQDEVIEQTPEHVQA